MAYKESEFLLLSGIQHFCFCRRQWALIHIEQVWAENGRTAEGRTLHERVHDRDRNESRGDVLTIRAMPVKSERLGVTGECDAVVFTKAAQGAVLHGRSGYWSVLPVEYKRGKQKANDCDRLQATVQAMCLEEMFCCDIEMAALFYFETRNREYIVLTPELRTRAEAMLQEMHDYFRRGHTPKVKPSRSCKSCSLRDLCLPELLRNKQSAASYIRTHLQEETP